MSVKILEVKKESFSAARFIGKKYTQGPNWGEWWENDWCFERYNCPGFTTPDNNGNVILDYGISIEK
jgi:hypothetical protein